MILVEYCIECGSIRPTVPCCPDCSVFFIEKEAAERINKNHRKKLRTFEELLAKVNAVPAATAWAQKDKVYSDACRDERERILAKNDLGMLLKANHNGYIDANLVSDSLEPTP